MILTVAVLVNNNARHIYTSKSKHEITMADLNPYTAKIALFNDFNE